MRTRIWEDAAAMSIVSVLGFIMNEEGEVVGSERTQVLCKLMPSIHTLSHRAILALLVTQLSDADSQVFYAEGGLKILNEWLLDGVSRRESGMSMEKKRIEMFSQVRALLRILDVNIQTDAQRKQNSYLTGTFVKVISILENAGPDYAAEWSRLNIYRRHFESSCGVPSSVNDGRSDFRRTVNNHMNDNNSRSTKVTAEKSIQRPCTSETLSSSTSTSDIPSRKPVAVDKSTVLTSTAPSSKSSTSSQRIPPSSVLQYQPKSFLQRDTGLSKPNQTLSASLENKIRGNGHNMQYGERSPCRKCKRMASKRCTNCEYCAKCGQKDKCEFKNVSPASQSSNGNSNGKNVVGSSISGKSLSVKDRNVQVLGSVMDAAIYHAFRQEDFHSVFSLIQNGMDVNFQRVESDLSSALMAAAHHGRDDAAAKLLSLGANPCLEDRTGNKAWNFAERRGHTELKEKLKKSCEEWESKHKDGDAELQS
ncbi:yth domain containing 2 [Plasmopara halstedii]|uniref:Yth domain containing 2 n=1 Tax=Plasmopara halstedii TaxID=4781 RepID=A0A0P1AN42_PLAHL|nr:yth domain containing 2 [Plasmopara halstedii]CEG42464.1 yth domain containing 2 [Plasmopara halstedii]|eukprot:XP_024578833.1 yth domain containing 2 [Plasmopara halstedii]